MTRRRHLEALSAPRRALALLSLVVVVAGCGSSGGSAPGRPGSAAAPSGARHMDGRSSHAGAVDPLTGEAASRNPVIAVKIEDTAAGRPQVGIDQADLVYVEQVEGGLTRLLAVYNTHLPVVEPVRSTRANDPELALEFGHIDYVASGGDRPELKPLDASPLRADINDRGGPGFSRDPHRVAPNNLRANLAAIARKLHGPTAKSVGLVWSARLPSSTRPGQTVRTSVGVTPVVFRWNQRLHRYVRYIGGAMDHTAGGQPVATPNVIVQFCRNTVYWRDKDVLGHPAEYTHTVGSGQVVVFRNGRRIDGTWHRRSVSDGTTLIDDRGKPIALAPGGAWFVLAARGTALRS